MIITQKVVIFSRACAILCYHNKNNVQTYAVIQLKAHVHPNGFVYKGIITTSFRQLVSKNYGIQVLSKSQVIFD